MSAVLNFDAYGQLSYDHEPFETEYPVYDLKKNIVEANNCPPTAIGQGWHGSVYDKTATEVLKIAYHHNGQEDGYYRYLELVLNNQHNPFYPKVHKFVKFKTNDGCNPPNDYTLYGVHMEKLISMYAIERDVQSKVGLNLIKDYDPPHMYLCVTISDICVRGDFDRIRNPFLVEALKEIKKLIATGLCNDLGSSNLMLRKTDDYDYHLVITDPVA